MSRYRITDFSSEVRDISNPNLSKTKIITRYDGKTRIRLEDNKLTVRNLKEADLVALKSENDIMHRVTLEEDSRADLIALKFYGDARLYWIILAANGLRDPGEVKREMLIRIPSKNSVYGSNGILSK